MEKMKRGAWIVIFLACMLPSMNAQGIHRGMLRTQGTLAAGIVNRSEEIRYYVYGELEYLLDDHVGFNGAIYGQVGSSKQEFPELIAPDGGDYFTHSVFAGPIYHFRQDTPLDLYVGLQPGLHLTQSPFVNQAWGIQYQESWSLSPSASALAGIAYYGSFFHVFGQLRALTGQNVKAGTLYGIAELRPTFGLGFNLF
jgi:hypothetical protein